jgi:hypothetical protein
LIERKCVGCGRALEDTEPLLFDEHRPGFVGAECRLGETLRVTADARRALAGFLSAPLDPAARRRAGARSRAFPVSRGGTFSGTSSRVSAC